MSVARSTGRPAAVVAHQDYRWTMWEYVQLQDLERLDAIRRGHERHDLAGLSAIAFHEPKRLRSEREAFEREAERSSLSPERLAQIAAEHAHARAEAERRIRILRRAARRGATFAAEES